MAMMTKLTRLSAAPSFEAASLFATAKCRNHRRGVLSLTSALLLGATLALGSFSSAYAQTTITYWTQVAPGDGSPRGNALKAALDSFETKNPDIKVQVEVVAPAMTDSNLIQSSAAGVGPDVTTVHQYKLAMDVEAGALMPLDELAASSDKQDWLLPWDANFIEGRKYAIPSVYIFNVLLYRADLLKAAGVQVPSTWDEMCSAAPKINSSQVIGYVVGLSRTDAAYTAIEWFENVMLSLKVPLFDKDGRAAFKTDAGLKPFETMKQLISCNATNKSIVEYNYESTTNGLSSGTVAMGNIGMHRLDTIRARGAGGNIAWAPPMNYTKGEAPPVAITGYSLAIGAHSKHPKEAWRFIEHMTGPQSQEIKAKAGEMPTRKSSFQQPFFSTPAAANMLQWSKYVSEHGSAHSYPPQWSDFALLVADAMQGIVLKGTAPSAARDRLIADYNSLIGKP